MDCKDRIGKIHGLILPKTLTNILIDRLVVATDTRS